MEKRFKIGTTVHLLLVQNNNILMQRRFKTGFEDGNYSVIAGHINGKETIRQAMIREAMEEASLKINLDDLKVVHVMHRQGLIEKVDFFLHAKRWFGEPIIAEPNKADDLQWFSLNSLPENTVGYVRAALESIEKNLFYSEYGWERLENLEES